ncbi:hypothetical protein VNO77_00076 [Canavalia gladiata]|uniref:Uncharacterized protein n=1 Tax=Canavalia gladiata TaxID=3824 RepID=A0AAN9MNY5_CANGL
MFNLGSSEVAWVWVVQLWFIGGSSARVHGVVRLGLGFMARVHGVVQLRLGFIGSGSSVVQLNSVASGGSSAWVGFYSLERVL